MYIYDRNGNQLAKVSETLTPATGAAAQVNIDASGVELYDYDGFNRMTRSNVNGVETDYSYRADGLRDKTTKTGVMGSTGPGSETRFIWDGANIVAELDGNNAVTARYIRGLNLLLSDSGGVQKFYLYNGHGDVVQLAGSNGAILWRYDYDAFGNEREIAGQDENLDTNPFRYCAEYFDKSSGTYYMRSRYYQPTTGRFLTADTIHSVSRKMPNGQELVDPLSLNLYTYCHNNPVMYIDENGHWVQIALGALAGGIFGGVSDLTIQLIANKGNTDNINWRSVGASFAAGAISGGMAGATAGLSLTLQGTIIAGALISANGYVTYNLVNGTKTTLAGLLWAAEFGSLLGGVSYRLNTVSYGIQGPKGALNNAKFAQKTYSENFSRDGVKIYSDLAGRQINTVSDLSLAIKTGAIKASDIEVQYIVRNGNTLILNTRTAQALTQAGVPRNSWNAVNVTGNAQFEKMLSDQLARNNLTSTGISYVTRN